MQQGRWGGIGIGKAGWSLMNTGGQTEPPQRQGGIVHSSVCIIVPKRGPTGRVDGNRGVWGATARHQMCKERCADFRLSQRTQKGGRRKLGHRVPQPTWAMVVMEGLLAYTNQTYLRSYTGTLAQHWAQSGLNAGTHTHQQGGKGKFPKLQLHSPRIPERMVSCPRLCPNAVVRCLVTPCLLRLARVVWFQSNPLELNGAAVLAMTGKNCVAIAS